MSLCIPAPVNSALASTVLTLNLGGEIGARTLNIFMSSTASKPSTDCKKVQKSYKLFQTA
jgi:hypothetical protein